VTITIKTELAVAIARWAMADHGDQLSAVVFRDGVVCATDGHAMCSLPIDTLADEFGVYRRDLLAAVAAQDVMAREEFYAKIDHDLKINDYEAQLTDWPRGTRELQLTCAGEDVRIDLGGITLSVPAAVISTYPTARVLDEMLSAKTCKGSPDGYLLNPRFLAEVERTNNATSGKSVRVVSWGKLGKQGAIDPVVLHGDTGARFAIMPMRDVKGQSK
jgi:hypothetical protein